LDAGYDLLATDISEEAISYCRKALPDHAQSFQVLDCISGKHENRYDFIYSVAVVHLLVEDEDRNAFYGFIHKHLKDDGFALICSMGDGKTEMESDISKAFTLSERNHASGKVMVAGTSCRMVSLKTFEKELGRNGFEIVEQGLTSALPDFDSMVYAIVRLSSRPYPHC
ncbi:MAG: class I SAM-dependent methyltransferase, partial [Spirochaetales bacterium]|nr:class I SAM-dependent methyltransferase [Spirochaetales bacterium]